MAYGSFDTSTPNLGCGSLVSEYSSKIPHYISQIHIAPDRHGFPERHLQYVPKTKNEAELGRDSFRLGRLSSYFP